MQIVYTERMNESNAKKRMVYGAIAAALVLAGALFLILQSPHKAVVFPDFSAADALDGKSDCFCNALCVLDRYAEEPNRAQPAELLLASYRDRDEREVLVSLLVESDEALYERLAPYFSEGSNKTELVMLSGYFFCEPLNRYNAGASDAFEADANDYIAWKGEGETVQNAVLLRYAGATEADYAASVRQRNGGDTVLVIVLFVLAAACGIRILTLSKTKTA